MTAPLLASLGALEKMLGVDPGSLTGAKEARAEDCLDFASALVREETRREWVDEDGEPEDVPHILVRIVLSCARRLYTNPDVEVRDQKGPFERELKHDDVSGGLTEDEKAICRRYRPEQPDGIWTMPRQRDTRVDTTIWVEDSFGSELFPLYDRDWM